MPTVQLTDMMCIAPKMYEVVGSHMHSRGISTAALQLWKNDGWAEREAPGARPPPVTDGEFAPLTSHGSTPQGVTAFCDGDDAVLANPFRVGKHAIWMHQGAEGQALQRAVGMAFGGWLQLLVAHGLRSGKQLLDDMERLRAKHRVALVDGAKETPLQWAGRLLVTFNKV